MGGRPVFLCEFLEVCCSEGLGTEKDVADSLLPLALAVRVWGSGVGVLDSLEEWCVSLLISFTNY